MVSRKKDATTLAQSRTKRDDFSKKTKDTLAKRVNYLCSFPDCDQRTTGPHTDNAKAISVGVAAHIAAAQPGGARFDPSMSADERRAPENGIWMCHHHATLIDRDPQKYSVPKLRTWKQEAEQRSAKAIERRPARKPNDSTGLRRVFSVRENDGFEYIFSELDILVAVSTDFLGEYPKGSTWRDHWSVKISKLELVLMEFDLDAPLFAFFNLRGRQITAFADGKPMDFLLDDDDFGGFLQDRIEKPLLKFGLVKSRAGHYELHFTDKMQRFVYWIEYNERFPTQSIAYKRDE